jgi:hypothetical protein
MWKDFLWKNDDQNFINIACGKDSFSPHLPVEKKALQP